MMGINRIENIRTEEIRGVANRENCLFRANESTDYASLAGPHINGRTQNVV